MGLQHPNPRQVVRDAGHELNNLAGALINYVALLELDRVAADHDDLGEIRDIAERLTELARTLHDAAVALCGES